MFFSQKIMKRISFYIISLLVISCSHDCLDSVRNEEQENCQNTESAVSGVAVVKFDEDFLSEAESDFMAGGVVTKSSEFNDLQQMLGVVSLKRMFPHAGKYEARTRAEGLHRWYIVNYKATVPYTKASGDFMTFKGIEVVEPFRPVVMSDCFDDPWMNRQWHYYNDGSLSPEHQKGADINVVPVWERYTTGCEDVVVAVIDGGIDQNHEDLAANCIGGYNFVSDSPVLTPHDHGTHVAGTIGAINNNGIGVAGIAGGNHKSMNPGVRLLSCQIFQQTGGEVDDSVDGSLAIKWAADNGAVIAQNSWGYKFDSYRDAKETEIPQFLKEAIDYFIKYAGMDENGNQTGPMKGGVVIFAAGNSGWDTDPIGLYHPVISVGAIGPDGTKTRYSNYGSWVDISAPGGDVQCQDGMVYSTLPDNQYGGFQGTSMACPHVSGVAALLVSYYGGLDFTADELKERLLSGADDSYPDIRTVGPVVDALSSMVYGNKIAPDPVTDMEVAVKNGRLHFEWSATVDPDEIVAYGYRIFVAKRISDLQDVASEVPLGVDRVEVIHKRSKVGDKLSAEYSKGQLGHTYYLAAVAFDRDDNVSPLSDIVTVRLPDNRPPVIVPLQDMPQSIKVGAHDLLELVFEITDPDNHEFDVMLKDATAFSGLIEKDPGVYSMTVKGNSNLSGEYVAILSVSDELGAKSEFQIHYELLPNMRPVLNHSMGDSILSSMSESIMLDFTDCFIDPDGGVLDYEVHLSDPAIMMVSRNGDVVSLVPVNYGMTEVAVTASDSYGAYAEMRFKVAVRNGSGVLVYPNPVSDFLNISVHDAVSAKVMLTSHSGNLEYERILALDPFKNIKIDMRGFPAGIYYLSVVGDGMSIEKQLIKL